ncbi:YpmS family protein [Enterococcus italicus]|uniref:YpmS family protein n=1 Tax=Enterococcus italicus TaxID=246144 RepID=UPI0020742E5E|nr:YpmS family protein [Enterococcus italicus]MCM6931367.1 YpmS family protein [Enterococcus italicus]
MKKTRISQTNKNQTTSKSFSFKKINGWMVAFFVLLGVVVGSGIVVANRILEPREVLTSNSAKLVERDGSPVVTIESTKQQVNELIAFYLQDYSEKSGLDYTFTLENQALLNGQFKVLGMPVNFYLYFDPYVMENGNVQLKAKSLSIGTLGVPIKEVMKLVKRSYKLPSWIEIKPSDGTVLIRLDQFRMQNGLFIKAEKIDLVDDEIKASLYLPASDEK